MVTHDWESSSVLWSPDLESWTQVADLGGVFLEAIDVGDDSIDLAVKEYSVNVSEGTGEIYQTDDGASLTLRLSPTG